MKRLIKIIAVSSLTLFTTYSCGDDFLDRQPQGSYSPVVTSTPEGIEALLVGAYGLLDGIGANTTQWHGAASNWVFGGLVSDDAYKGTDAGDQPEQTFLERFVWIPTNDHIKGKWKALFDGIIRANDVLQTLPNVKGLSDSRKKQIEGEARFLRGYYYFEAKKMWNKVPYIDDKTYQSADPNSVKVPNTDDIWGKIEADFAAAAAVLPDEFADEPGRVDKWAAKAMLGKSYLFQGFDIGSGAPNATKLTAAKKEFDDIINSKKFKLMNNVGDNYSANTRNNPESIFEIQYSLTSTADGGGNQGDGLAWPYNAGPGGCCGFYQPAQNLVNAYQVDANGLPLLDNFNVTDLKSDQGVDSDKSFTIEQKPVDPRLDHTVGRRYIPYKDWGICPGKDWVRDQAYAGPYCPKKHISEKSKSGVSGWTNLNSNNYRYLRYSHVLLYAAECEVEVGSLEKAREYVNLIRERAGKPESMIMGRVVDFKGGNFKDPILDMSKTAAIYNVKTYAAAWTDKAVARKAVRFENRLEFAMEGHRFFDLVRWGVAADVMNTYIAKEKDQRTYLNGAAFQKGKHEYYPIPLSEIVNSSKDGKPTLTQNPNY
jgi:starch-binding outer membrane protein, SusD/RagB family